MLDYVDSNSKSAKDNNNQGKGESKCPFKNYVKPNPNNNNIEIKQRDFLNEFDRLNSTSIVENMSKCPLNHEMLKLYSLNNNNKSNPSSLDIEEDNIISSNSGCPVFNMIKQEPEENFSVCYEIPYESPYDFLFNTIGSLSKKQFLEKTNKLRTMPRHLRYSLIYLKEDKLIQLRKKEFPRIYFAFEEIREKAYDFYCKKEYKHAINYYIFTYSIFKWLEFKDSYRERDILNAKELLPILDEDVIEKRIETDIYENLYEEECFETCLTIILKQIALCYMHLRHFNEAVSCLNEAIDYAKDKVPELYLRRSQARAFNKFSDVKQLELALKDINKAINLNVNEPRFRIHLTTLNNLIEETMTKEIRRTEKLFQNAKYSFQKIKDKKLNLNDYLYSSYDHIETNNKVLDEMIHKYKNTLKFHNETNNNKQISLAYKEIEEFSEVYYKFKWYYLLDVNNLSEDVNKGLSFEDKDLIKHPDFQRIIQDYKFKTCEDIFSKAKFNFKLFSYALDKVIEEEKMRKEISKKYCTTNCGKSWSFDLIMVKNKGGFFTLSAMLILVSIIVLIYHFNIYSDRTKSNV